MQPLIIDTPLYLDWTFWSVIFSAIAVILSQLPPVRLWLKKAKIDFEIHSKICLLHKIGNPNLHIHVLISNIGGKKIKIKKINAQIESDQKKLAQLPTQDYLQTPSDKNGILFTTFSLKPTEEWKHSVNLYNEFSREDEQKFQGFRKNLMENIRTKLDSRNKENSQEQMEADPEHVNPIKLFFDNHFIWNAGEYKLTVNILTDHASANTSKSFRFTIFESHTEQLKLIVDRYKYGEDILYPPSELMGGLPQVALNIVEVFS